MAVHDPSRRLRAVLPLVAAASCVLVAARVRGDVAAEGSTGSATPETEVAAAAAAPDPIGRDRYAPGDDASPGFALETVLRGLDNPCGLALRPGSPDEGPHALFFSESGAGRVLAVATDDLAAPRPAVIGFPRGTWGDAPGYRVGPLGVAFLTRTKLAVAGSGPNEGEQRVTVHALNDDLSAAAYDDADHALAAGPQLPGTPPRSVGRFFGLARTEATLFVASLGQRGEGGLLRAAIDANRLSALRAASNAELPSLDGAAGVTVNPQPGLGYLASSHVGARGPERDSFVAFSSPSSGKLALALPVGLFDVVALAYSPSGNLYAADFAEQAADEGGVFRIDEVLLDNRQACRAVRVARVRHPTSLLFTPDGTLWVTAWEGSEPASADAETPRGVVLKIRGDL